MQSDPILLLTWSWDCRVRRAEASLCPVFILNNGKKKRLWTAGERERPDQSLDGSHLPLYFCCCVVLFVVLFL